MNLLRNHFGPVKTSLLAVAAALAPAAISAPVGLQNATATFSQTYYGDFSPGRAIDGDPGGDYGWAIYDGNEFGGTTSAQSAVFETATDAGGPGGSIVEFTLEFNLWWNPGHQLGRFQLLATTDDRSTFADGAATGGDVDANWTVLEVLSFGSNAGAITQINPDQSLLAYSVYFPTDVYTVRTRTDLAGITGFRIDALEDPSLPTSGPGLQPDNGNFVLSNLEVDVSAAPVPEAGASPLVFLLFGAWLGVRKVRQSQGR